MDLEKCYMKPSVKTQEPIQNYFKETFDILLDLLQALTTNVSY